MPPAWHVGLLRPRVLIVAELSLPQCRKYRVDQKHDMIEALGWDCTVVAWQQTDRVLTLMQTHSVVIFYRVPAFPEILPIIQEADFLGLPHYFELDDLIFDLDDYAANPNLIGLDPATREASCCDQHACLSGQEFSLLQALMVRSGAILPRSELVCDVRFM